MTTTSANNDDRPLRGKRVLILTGDIYEDLELWYPKLRLEEAGATTTLAGPEAGKTYTGKNGYPCVSDAALEQMNEADFDALVVPGGFMPDKLRRDEHVRSAHVLFRRFEQCTASFERIAVATEQVELPRKLQSGLPDVAVRQCANDTGHAGTRQALSAVAGVRRDARCEIECRFGAHRACGADTRFGGIDVTVRLQCDGNQT